jgi:DNA-binding XRE family transcriptional regulator
MEEINEARKSLIPAPWDIRSARKQTGFTMQEAADMVYVTRNTWLCWERNPDHRLYKKMHPAYAELFALKAGLKELPEVVRILNANKEKP